MNTKVNHGSNGGSKMENGISSLFGKFLGRDVTDEHLKERKTIPLIHMTREEWTERRKKLLKIRLP